MPCDCSGYHAEITAFGKTYTGATTNYGDTIDYRQAIKDGEHALCRAQQVIRDLLKTIDKYESVHCRPQHVVIDQPLRIRADAELRMLKAHVASEQAKLDEAAAKQREYDAAEQKQLEEEKKQLERRLKALDARLK